MDDTCGCFPGTCRGGEVVNGKLANGLWCRMEDKRCAPAEPPEDSKSCTLCGSTEHLAKDCPWRKER